MPRSYEDFVFFWRPSEPNGWASQWYPSHFRAPVKFPGADEPEEVVFPTAEHWMMVQKAVLFGDYEIARKIIATKGVQSADCAKVRGMGRKVKNFDDDTWLNARERIVLEGTMHKFRQSEDLWKRLNGTGDKILVEASPFDNVWGIGYEAKYALAQGEGKWGLNLLGKALMQARSMLDNKEKLFDV